MRTLGLIGGMSWYSTQQYYRVLNEGVQAALGGHHSAPLALQSLNFQQVRQLQVAQDWAAAGDLLAQAANRCEAAGAQAVMICTNLMHKVAPAVEDAMGVPLLHIGDALAAAARSNGWDRLGLLGTRWTMEEEFYSERLTATGLEVVVPQETDRAVVDHIIFDELTIGEVRDASRLEYQRIISDLQRDGAQAIILGCTEIELLVKQDDAPLPLLDSMRTHAEYGVDFILSRQSPNTSARS